ncbi:MAG TPA: VTT domain-containing protein [Vicinamibacterales bacterium]
MKSFIGWIQAFAQTLGAPGLFLVAFLDSSFLSLPQINDLLLVLSVAKRPHLMPLYAAMATLGSIAGCFVMYAIGRKGGEALLRKRAKGKGADRLVRLFERFGVLAIIVPALLPPPAPFKLFVILAGAARMSPVTFGIGVAVGRGVRYFGEGWLAVMYGEQAIGFLEDHGREVALGLGLAALVGGILYYYFKSRRSQGQVRSSDSPAS